MRANRIDVYATRRLAERRRFQVHQSALRPKPEYWTDPTFGIRYDIMHTSKSITAGELLWIDEHLFDGNALRNEFFKPLVGRVKPLFEGVQELRFVRDEVTDRIVVLGDAESRLRYGHSSHDKSLKGGKNSGGEFLHLRKQP